MKTESGEKQGVSEKYEGPNVHNDHIKLQTKHTVQYMRQGLKNVWYSLYKLCTNTKL
jgi:hypothetical protein